MNDIVNFIAWVKDNNVRAFPDSNQILDVFAVTRDLNDGLILEVYKDVSKHVLVRYHCIYI